MCCADSFALRTLGANQYIDPTIQDEVHSTPVAAPQARQADTATSEAKLRQVCLLVQRRSLASVSG